MCSFLLSLVGKEPKEKKLLIFIFLRRRPTGLHHLLHHIKPDSGLCFILPNGYHVEHVKVAHVWRIGVTLLVDTPLKLCGVCVAWNTKFLMSDQEQGLPVGSFRAMIKNDKRIFTLFCRGHFDCSPLVQDKEWLAVTTNNFNGRNTVCIMHTCANILGL